MTFPVSVISMVDPTRRDNPYVFSVEDVEDQSGLDFNG